jgi:KDO2-lipid IV(A) lauroyltransferase
LRGGTAQPRLAKRLVYGAIAVLARCLGAAVRALPWAAALRVGAALGWLAARALPGRARIARQNLAQAFPELERHERAALLHEHFAHLGKCIVELLRFPMWRAQFSGRVRVEGQEHLDVASACGRGIVVFTGHTGNWEILAPLWPLLHPRPMVVAQPMRNPSLERLVSACRQVNGLTIVPREGSLRRLVAGLREGRAVGLLADQDAGPGGVFVPFFGRLASCEPSPVVLARRLACPLLLCLAFRDPDGTHRVVFESVHAPVAENDAAADRATLAYLYQRLETHIRACPSQWLWVHRRWKTRPAGIESSP